MLDAAPNRLTLRASGNTAPVPGSRWVRLPASATAPALARDAVRDLLASIPIDGETGELVVLLVSEVVTNALLHGEGPIGMALESSDGQLTIGVADRCPQRTLELRHPGPEATSGRGLQFLDEFAARWWVEQGDGAKTVWFRVDFPTPDP